MPGDPHHDARSGREARPAPTFKPYDLGFKAALIPKYALKTKDGIINH